MNQRAKTFVLFITCLIVGTLSDSSAFGCVENADCTIVDRKIMLCSGLNLSSVACALDTGIEYLDLSENLIRGLSNYEFPSTLNHLRVLVLRNVSLKVIKPLAFAHLTQLVNLDLSVNLLKVVTVELFRENIYLEKLNLSTNLLKRLESRQFVLPNLRILDLSNCFVDRIEDDTFNDLPSLEWLNLGGNRLKTLTVEANVPVVLLNDNPWICDCENFVTNMKYVDVQTRNSSCKYDGESEPIKWNETNFIAESCKDVVRKLLQVRADKKERSSKTEENGTDVIFTVYGYVFVGITILIFLCCCCDKPKENRRLSQPC